MPNALLNKSSDVLDVVDPNTPVLIAGPTASGKSALALAIAQAQGGVIVNADASQVYDCWRVISARPSKQEVAQVPHLLYGHVDATSIYSVGHWLREVTQILTQDQRPIIVGGTGLYFNALTAGLADIPPVPDAVRSQASSTHIDDMIAGLDPETAGRIDLNNPRRVQRAWEVLAATGRGLADWQDSTPPPLLALNRFDQMLEQGALDEVAAVLETYNPTLPAHQAIGVPELICYLRGKLTLDVARLDAIIATRQYAKRQRTWLRKNTTNWLEYSPHGQ